MPLESLTLTAMMYAMVAKVVRPARISVMKLASGISSTYKCGTPLDMTNKKG